MTESGESDSAAQESGPDTGPVPGTAAPEGGAHAHSRLRLRYAARSDIGLVRQGNEDSGYAGGHMLVVADGMGGHAAGELASATTVAIFAELDQAPPGENVLTALADAVDHAHEELSRIVSDSPDFAGMGTTVTAISWEGSRVALAHVGDSRAYLLREGRLSQLTKDHTFVQTLVDSGRITSEQAAVHEKRNLLIKALDGIHIVEPDLSMREVRAGDRFLLCSDGLTGVLNDAKLLELLLISDPTGAVTALVERALEGGAPDNVTCVVADLVEDPIDPLNTSPGAGAELQPVVVGAAAELRNRDRLPGIAFPEDSQPDPDRPAPDPEAAAAAEATDRIVSPVAPRRRRALWVPISIAALLALLVGSVGFWAWAHNQYYVGNVNNKIGIYQGITGGPGPHGFSKAIQTSGTDVNQLPAYYQEQVAQTIPAQSLDEARSTLAELEAKAAECQRPPAPLGCPTNPGPTGQSPS